jgi:adenine phosphoribosyltransferase
MKKYLELIDTHTQGNRNDVTPLFADPGAFADLIDDLAEPFRGEPFEYVAGIDALGFILGAALALKLGKGFLPLRKGGKLPVAVISREFSDYSGQVKTLELRQGMIKAGDRVLLADEWIETGAQVKAAIGLIESQGGIVFGIASINIDNNLQTESLMKKYRFHVLLSGD